MSNETSINKSDSNDLGANITSENNQLCLIHNVKLFTIKLEGKMPLTDIATHS